MSVQFVQTEHLKDQTLILFEYLPLEQGLEVQWSIFFSQLNPAYPVGHWQK